MLDRFHSGHASSSKFWDLLTQQDVRLYITEHRAANGSGDHRRDLEADLASIDLSCQNC